MIPLSLMDNLPTKQELIWIGVILSIFFWGLVLKEIIYDWYYLPWKEEREMATQPQPPPRPQPKIWTDKELYELRQEHSWGKLEETTGLTQGQLRYRIQRYRKNRIG